jgi:protein SCO1/2
MRGAIILSVLAALAAPAALWAQAVRPKPPPEVTIEQRLNAAVPPELVFRDESGREVRLGDYFGQRPVILTLAYYRCPMLCNQVLNGLVDALRPLPLDPGRDFEILTVSFDPRELPPMAAAKKQSYVEAYARPGAARGWHFLTGRKDQIDRLCEVVGFQYEYDPDLNQYAHGSAIMILTPEGRVARYFFGIQYRPEEVRQALEAAADRQPGSFAQQVFLLCYAYDPATGEYRLAVFRLVRVAGAVTVVLLAGFLVWLWRGERRRKAAAAP